jgi:hypothetical protein
MNLVHALLALGVLMTAIGGVLDLLGWDSLLGFSKYHFWNDGVFLVLVAGVLAILKRKE